jgi:hypothetical protein
VNGVELRGPRVDHVLAAAQRVQAGGPLLVDPAE